MSSEAYRAKAEAKLEEFQGRIITARGQLKGASADVRIDLEKQIDRMEKELATAKKKAGELADDAGEKWSELTEQVEDAFGGIASAVKGFFSKS